MKNFQKAPLALAITALMTAPYAMAEYSGSSSVESTFINSIDVSISHTADSTRTIDVTGGSDFTTEDYGGAIVDSKQFSNNNEVDNVNNTNSAIVGDDESGEGTAGMGAGASGNIGVNVAAGDANNQANDAALATTDAASVFGQAAAFSAQTASNNTVTNADSTNTASLGAGALAGATGNIAVNVAAGVGNGQQNSLVSATSTGTGSVEATAGGVQQTFDNNVMNGAASLGEQEVALDLALDVSNLQMDQIGDVYLDFWGLADGDSTSDPHLHASGVAGGHLDVDSEAQGAVDLNNDGGAFAFGAAGDTVLAGTITGFMPTVTVNSIGHENIASLGGGALAGASGNIGVNIVAGSNNLQRNSLSIASVTGAPGNGNGNGGGGEMPPQ